MSAPHTHAFVDWPFSDEVDTATYCTAKVARLGFPVLRVTHEEDGDWQFLDATTEDPGECVLLCLGCVLESDPSLAQIGDLPRGWSACRSEVGADWDCWKKPPALDDRQQQALDNIDTYGLHILHVREEGDLPAFSYSIGIEKTLGMPELIIVGLRHEVAQAAINACYSQMKSGTDVAPGARIAGLLGGGFECQIGDVTSTHAANYMGWASWLYGDEPFRACQIIFPNTAGVFPWERTADAWFKSQQPLLAETREGMSPQHKLRFAHVLMTIGILPWVMSFAWGAPLLLADNPADAPGVPVLDPIAMTGVLALSFATGVVVAGLSALWSCALTARYPELRSGKVVMCRAAVAVALAIPPLLLLAA